MDIQSERGRCACSDQGLLRYFQDMPDPRRDDNTLHRLGDMIVIAICAVICGADGWVQVMEFGQAKRKWFATFLGLPNGIPSHDTFGRVFARLDPDAFERCFTAWMAALTAGNTGGLVAIDGKAIRRSFEHAWDISGMAHLVSAFAGANRVVMGQLAVEDKSNEITAIPKLLEVLNVRGATVTIDAIGCQKKIAKRILEEGGDYLLAVKKNQRALHRKMQLLFNDALLGGFEGVPHDFFEEVEGDHGRIETRRVWSTSEVQWLGKIGRQWPQLNTLVLVQSVREVNGQTTTEHRYYISSHGKASAEQLAAMVRGHWGIENRLHWMLDVNFNEDDSRIRKGHGAQNFSRLRRIALNLLQRDTKKVGIKTKRLRAGWDHDYLLGLILG